MHWVEFTWNVKYELHNIAKYCPFMKSMSNESANLVISSVMTWLIQKNLYHMWIEVFWAEDGTAENTEIENMNDARAEIYLKRFFT